jgi:hypothetical protein
MIDFVHAVDLEDSIRTVADENPDKIYVRPVRDGDLEPLAVYFTDDGAPSCLVGQALARLGVTIEQVEGNNTDGVLYLFGTGLIEGDREEVEWLENLQYNQDQGMTWQNAVLVADEETEGFDDQD